MRYRHSGLRTSLATYCTADGRRHGSETAWDRWGWDGVEEGEACRAVSGWGGTGSGGEGLSSGVLWSSIAENTAP